MINGLIDRLFGQEHQEKKGSSKNIKHGRNSISDLLELYLRENHFLTAVVMDTGKRRLAKLNSGIVDVDPDAHRFACDAFLPKEANALMTPGVKVRFSLTHQGIRHQFEALYNDKDPSRSEDLHWFSFPKGIEQVQLRDAFRVKLSQISSIKVTLTHDSNPTLSGGLVDLSASGMRVKIQGFLDPKPERGEIYSACHLALSDGTPIVCGGKLMHWQVEQERKVTYLGVQFTELDGNTQRTLNWFLTDMQRKSRQLS